ncbi:DUF2171 domain-containing protein [Roseomonas sp. M0104]|uniref:DUF2171 domain-containing protein n=1 Tax=Teichococcus coralli TaxID=2545983 RepID=A0A845BH62_9PROT|nr:DUF2171 domain-containing protein [Pseudoroseomonas coralli]MXP65420.1 DUF2171 domain-containing protein [Pseudoroseomonas coralli]
MIDKSQITPHTAIVGSDGVHIGTVDGVEGDFIKLTKSDSADGRHHYLPASAIADQEGDKLTTLMNHTAAQSLLQDSPEAGEPGSNFVTGS